ncbi:MAG: DUF4229 domain-containing protein [Actinomycetota bacterium]
MARYTVLRLMIFFGLFCALWLLGLRDASQQWWLLGLSAIGSMVVSYFVLQGPRAQFSASIARRVDVRARRAEQAQSAVLAEDTDETDETDETVEDALADEDSAHP